MNERPAEIQRRREAAIAAMHQAVGTTADEHGATLFVSHHLEEIDELFWQKYCGVPSPTAAEVLDILVLESHWGEDDEEGIEVFDFTLPDGVTNYVISVRFDEDGNVSGVSMES